MSQFARKEQNWFRTNFLGSEPILFYKRERASRFKIRSGDQNWDRALSVWKPDQCLQKSAYQGWTETSERYIISSPNVSSAHITLGSDDQYLLQVVAVVCSYKWLQSVMFFQQPLAVDSGSVF